MKAVTDKIRMRKGRPCNIAAEAAVWIARLHGPDRSETMEREFSDWLAISPAHQAAFERATNTWNTVGEVSAAIAYRQRPGERKQPDRWTRLAWGGMVAAIFVLGVLVARPLLQPESSYVTHIGEQRSVTLADGSRVALNTNTRLSVVKQGDIRLVKLDSGEAFFDVAKDPAHPFVVDAGTEKITALGTAFSVRREGDKVTVTLVEGKIAVTKVATAKMRILGESQSPLFLEAGQRIESTLISKPKIDFPSMEQVTAWRRGEVVLDSTPLSEAVAEMNRYSNKQIVINDPDAQKLLVSGIFRVGDSEAFANAVGKVYGLKLIVVNEQLQLAASPPGP